MKRWIVMIGIASALAACEKEADMEKMDKDYLVYTNYDTGTHFDEFGTYYLPDSILRIGDKDKPEYLNDENAQKLINEFAIQMNEKGFVRTTDKDAADLGLQVSYVASNYYFTLYGENDNIPWWNRYPGYWYPGYWGGNWGGGWYYPYFITYRFSTGSLLADLVNLKAPEGQNERLPVLWNAFISNTPDGSSRMQVDRAITAIRQAFEQSPHLKK